MSDHVTIDIPIITTEIHPETEQTGVSVFREKTYSLEDFNGLYITPRIDAQNFRHRYSKPGYTSSWHMAGDPTLIIIQRGVLRIGLRNGEYRDFAAGDMFIAQDNLQEGEVFDDTLHGHNAKLMGDIALHAVHIKLAQKAD